MQRPTGRRFVVSAALTFSLSLVAVPATGAEQEEPQPHGPFDLQAFGGYATTEIMEIAQFADTQVTFDIPAQPLTRALTAFGVQSGMQVTVDGALVRDVQAPAVIGQMRAEDALQQLLSGTNLTYHITGGTTVAIERIEGSAVVLNPITVEGQGESAYGRVEGYSVTRSATGTKTDTSIRDTPASIQVIPRDIIEDQGARSLADVYENVSGVNQAGNTLNAQSEVLPFIRGFESPTMMRNGMRISDVGAVDLLNAERVEVLKGPASILYGALEPGGIINLVSKRPTATRAYSLEQQIGSYNYYRSEGEATGAITEDGRLSYRAALAYTDSDSFRDKMYLERISSGGGLLWQPTARTEILLDLAYLHEEQPYDTGVPIGFNGEQLVSDDTSFIDPDLKGRDITDYNATLQVSHELNEDWTVRNQLLFHMTDAKNESIRPRGVAGTVGAEVIRLRFQDEDRTEAQVQTTTDLITKFSTGGAEHNALVGTELFYDKSKFARRRQNIANVAISDDAVVDAGTADFEGKKTDIRKGDTVQGALYVQDQISMLENDRLKLLFGGRYDAVKTEYTIGAVSSADVVDHAMTGRVGALYDVTRNTGVYASYSQSFVPVYPGTVDVSGQPLPPETGYQYEAGVKFQTDDERLSATASVYHIKKRNVAEYDTTTLAYVRGVDHQTQGIEFDVTGEITDGLQLLAYYSYTDSEVLRNEDNPNTVGSRLGGVPLHKAKIWARYNFAENTSLRGFGIGGGPSFVGESSAQFDSSVKLDPYVVFDAAAWYQWNEAIKLRLNVKNILDEHYYVRASDQSIVHPGEPFSVIGSLSMTF